MIVSTNRVVNVREWFRYLKRTEQYVTDKSGCKMLEVIGATFIADEDSIFGTVNWDYVNRELAWYASRSCNVNDIPGGPPKEWVRCAAKDGTINSNYGFLVWDPKNFDQYVNVFRELQTNPDSRRAVMVYTRPSIWGEYNSNGMSDFICTNTVQYFIRDGKLVSLVQMRSNDLVWGYRNDRAFQDHVHKKLAENLDIETGDLIWHAGSLHCYERHFDMIE